MLIHFISIGTKMPGWVNDGYDEYQKRLAGEYKLKLIEIPAEKRTRNSNSTQHIKTEGTKILNALTTHHYTIALDVKGRPWSTEQLAEFLKEQHHKSQNIDLVMGGPDGLDPRCLEKANFTWSLSSLTFPHPLVRVIVAEQIYRAWTLLKHHPYHK